MGGPSKRAESSSEMGLDYLKEIYDNKHIKLFELRELPPSDVLRGAVCLYV